jgi:hypothetical protein
VTLAGDPNAVDARLAAALDEDLAAALLGWQQELGAHIVYQRPLDGGYTRARVFSVIVNEVEGGVRKCVLKAVPAGERGRREGDAHAAALAAGPAEFVAAHLVEQPYPQWLSDAGGVLLFQAIAGGDMSTFRPLANIYDNGQLPTIAAQIARSLLEDWAPDASVDTMTAQDCVRAQLGRRGETGGALHGWAAIVGEGAHARWLRFAPSGPVLPNPLGWLAEDAEGNSRVAVHLGRAHGDLHLDNVFIRFGPQPEAASYQLIDLSEWAEKAPLCRDVPHLLLATIGKHLGAIPTGRRGQLATRILDAATGVARVPGSLQDYGFERLADELLAAGDEWAASHAMLDDWRVEQLLGVIAAALIQASVSVNHHEIRWWFFELAAAGLARHLAPAEAPTDGEDALVGPAAGHGGAVAAVASRLDDVVAGFSRRKGTVLVVGECGLADPAAIAREPWDLIIEFDPVTDQTGAYAHKSDDRDHRLVTFEQDASFSPQTTVWLAADGIEGGRAAPEDLRGWRRECLPGVRRVIEAFATASARPVVVCAAGALGGKARVVVEELLDAFATRAELLVVSDDGVLGLADYSPELLEADAAAVLGALPDRAAPDESPREITIPARRDDLFGFPVAIDEPDLAWISTSGQLVHSELGRSADREAAVGQGFYRGERISWLELDIGVDVQREITKDLRDAVERDLYNRDSRRISLHHYPGAGGTTVARRIAWDLHDLYPVLMVEQAEDAIALVDRVRRIHAMTDNATLVVVESTLNVVIDLAYSAIRADSLPCVFLLVERRAEEPGEIGERRFYLGQLSREERTSFVATFGEQVPERHPHLTRLAGATGRAVVPFLFGLTTYEADYTGLDAYVERSLAALTDGERDALKLISLVHHYAGLPLPSVLLAGVLDVPAEHGVELAGLVRPELITLLIEGHPEYWRTMHDLIAHKSLVQLLTRGGPTALRGTEDWKVALSTLSAQLIRQAAAEFGSLIPNDVRAIIEQLFIVRNNTAVFTGERQLFSELMSDIPAAEGRIDVLRTLAHSFPEEPHFWAHLGRMLSYFAKDHPAALEAIDTALNMQSEDDVLYHVKGIILRNKMRTAVENRERLDPQELRERVLEVVREARVQFERSIALNDESEYGHVAIVQLCIAAIEFGRSQSRADTYSAFLAAPESAYYRELLALAEENLEPVREIRAGDRPSRYAAAAEAEIQAFYDDYAALLQGWRNLLDRQDLAKPLIRRQLVRAYHRRAGSWRAAQAEDRARAMELLDQNLRDDPSDTVSLMEWLRVGRFRGVTLDRASELIQYSSVDPARTPSRDVLFYDYVITALLALAGRDTAVMEYRRKVERSRERATSFGNRRFIYEWFTRGTGLGQLVHHTDLRDWDRSASGDDPPLLTRVEGRVQKIRRPQSGQINFGSGLLAFFSPGRSGLVADRDTNARVSFLLGFSYDGPQAWSVRLLDGGARHAWGSHQEGGPETARRRTSDEADPFGTKEAAR